MAATTIVISPKGSLAPTETYYSVAAEYLQLEPLVGDLLRFVLYPWAYQPNRTISGVILPPQ